MNISPTIPHRQPRTLSLEQALGELWQRGFGVYQAPEFAVEISNDHRVTFLNRFKRTEERFRWQQHTPVDDGLPFRGTRGFVDLTECLENAYLEMFDEAVTVIAD